VKVLQIFQEFSMNERQMRGEDDRAIGMPLEFESIPGSDKSVNLYLRAAVNT
jgi:hypothetical protein